MLKLILLKTLIAISLVSTLGCSKKLSESSDYLLYNVELKNLGADADIRGILPQRIEETIVSVFNNESRTAQQNYIFKDGRLTDIVSDQNYSIRFEYNENGKISSYVSYNSTDEKDGNFYFKYSTIINAMFISYSGQNSSKFFF